MLFGGILGLGKVGTCPRCGKEGDVRLARVEGRIERVLAMFRLHPFRCLHCRSRFRRFFAGAASSSEDLSRDLEEKGGTRKSKPRRKRKRPVAAATEGDLESFEAVIAEVRKAEAELERRESRKPRTDSIPRIG